MNEKSAFEDNIKKLEEIVRRLEKGETTLEESLKAFEEGISLIRICQEQLERVTERVQLLTRDGKSVDLQPKAGEE